MGKTIQDRCRGVLVGGAIGDAFDYPVEFIYSFEEIKAKYGKDGLTEYDKSYPWLEAYLRHYKALFSDDTQMTLYTAEGIIDSAKNDKPLMLPSVMPTSLGMVHKLGRKLESATIRNFPKLRNLISVVRLEILV